MKIKNKIKSYSVIIAYLIIGLIIMGTVQLIKLPNWLNSSIIILLLFILINIITSKIFKLDNDIKTFWSLKKIPYLFLGIIIGGLIVTTPILVGLIIGKISINEIILCTDVARPVSTILSILLTLVIITWEELWFRGIFLNYCNKHLSAINISIIIGLLFMLVHILNPEINLLKTGPTLSFAGAFLTIVYFYFKTIWLPIGLHFGNNFFTFETKIENHLILGNEGYFGAFLLAGLFFLFVVLIRKKSKNNFNNSKIISQYDLFEYTVKMKNNF